MPFIIFEAAKTGNIKGYSVYENDTTELTVDGLWQNLNQDYETSMHG
ncbi:MAG: hypothetical protein K2X86_09565 [Cytophagaceae bacterium]|nr:hypothetical protein [Cytophagaceae bacterium]